MLVDNEVVLETIFSNIDMVIAAHCEDEATIRHNLEHFKSLYGDQIPVSAHPLIRSEEACYLSSSRAIALAEKQELDCMCSMCLLERRLLFSVMIYH